MNESKPWSPFRFRGTDVSGMLPPPCPHARQVQKNRGDALSGVCADCGLTMWVIPSPVNTAPTDCVTAYKALRAAWHARTWK